MQNRKFNNPKKECKTLKNIEKKTGWVPGAPHKTDPRADPPDEPKVKPEETLGETKGTP